MTPERDYFSSQDMVAILSPAVLAADNTPAAIDMLNYRGATLLLAIGAGGITFTTTNKIEFVLSHGNTTTVASHTPVTAADLILDGLAPATITNGIVRALVAAHAAGTVQKIGYIGGRRYLSLLADFSGTHATGTPISATLIAERPEVQRVA